jgi:hypothetical protein
LATVQCPFQFQDGPFQFQDAQLAAGIITQEAKQRPEQPEEIFAAADFPVALQQRPGCADIHPRPLFSLEDVVLADALLVLLDLPGERVGRAIHDGTEEYRSYHRSVTLPVGVKADEIQAQYRNGVLEIHLPKSEEAQPKRIPVQA